MPKQNDGTQRGSIMLRRGHWTVRDASGVTIRYLILGNVTPWPLDPRHLYLRTLHACRTGISTVDRSTIGTANGAHVATAHLWRLARYGC